MWKMGRKFFIPLVFLFSFVISGFNVHAEQTVSPNILDEIRRHIQDYYVDPINKNSLQGSTPQDIVKYLDKYSTYMTAEEYEQFLDSIDIEFVGIGITMEEDEAGIKVMSVLENSPAARAGLQAGDIITEVDGQSLAGNAVESAATLITGQEGTTVHLKILRPETNETFSVSVVREKINWPNVEFSRLSGNIGYIRLYSFDHESIKEIEKAIRSLSGVKGWIFDLRDNPGGYVDAAQEILGFFPNVKYAFQLRDRSNKPTVYGAIEQPVKMTGLVHVLVNSSSASASEMVAASVKEQKGAVLYGQRTFGKGSMQELFQLSDGSVLKLTVARFFSPNGTPIHEVGVKPNVVTAVNKELYFAHRDLLLKQLRNYQSLGKLRNVATNKTFTVKLSRKLSVTNASQLGIKLYRIGGQEVPVTVQGKGNQLVIKPNVPLVKGENYLLIIPPTIKSKDGRVMKQGTYLEISVAK
ncbi:MAG TPA: S41 family peptidase [Anoxybacillus sp.]|jgi:carboxyl-terminal processing protease|nr:S41 family peptidase [Anoxybacillus sp.]